MFVKIPQDTLLAGLGDQRPRDYRPAELFADRIGDSRNSGGAPPSGWWCRNSPYALLQKAEYRAVQRIRPCHASSTARDGIPITWPSRSAAAQQRSHCRKPVSMSARGCQGHVLNTAGGRPRFATAEVARSNPISPRSRTRRLYVVRAAPDSPVGQTAPVATNWRRVCSPKAGATVIDIFVGSMIVLLVVVPMTLLMRRAVTRAENARRRRREAWAAGGPGARQRGTPAGTASPPPAEVAAGAVAAGAAAAAAGAAAAGAAAAAAAAAGVNLLAAGIPLTL